jgi:hypothetical protein
MSNPNRIIAVLAANRPSSAAMSRMPMNMQMRTIMMEADQRQLAPLGSIEWSTGTQLGAPGHGTHGDGLPAGQA